MRDAATTTPADLATLRPSQTRRGRAWVDNFHPSETDTARLLLDSLDIVSDAQIRSGLERRIRQLKDPDGSVLLVPVLGVNDIKRLVSDAAKQLGLIPQPVRAHVAYETYVPGMPILSTSGSEAIIGNVVRTFTGDNPVTQRSPRKGGTPWLHPATKKEVLAAYRCRRIVLITDYSGSGRQVVEFAETFARNKTIRSWRSSRLVRITSLAFAASASARAMIEASHAVDDLIVERPARTFEDAGWSSEDRAAIEMLCTTYAGEARGAQDEALGRDESRGLIATHSSVPNNLPFVLRRRDSGWRSFFLGRTFPDQLRVELGRYRASPTSLQSLAEEARQQRLARAIGSGRLASPTDLLAVLLALLAHRRHSLADLAHRLHRPDAEVQNLVDFLRRSELVTSDLTVTDKGRAELKNAKRLERVVTARLTGRSDPYYPQSLR